MFTKQNKIYTAKQNRKFTNVLYLQNKSKMFTDQLCLQNKTNVDRQVTFTKPTTQNVYKHIMFTKLNKSLQTGYVYKTKS